MKLRSLFLRATVAFLVLPGTVAFGIPLFLLRPSPLASSFAPMAIAAVGLGSAVLVWCVWDFYVRGRGTLAPWDPPQALVWDGLYKYSRNPMYVGVLAIVVGWAIGFRSSALAIYAGCLAVAFHLRIVFAEEPFLARTHGAAWVEYRERVPRWLFRRRRAAG